MQEYARLSRVSQGIFLYMLTKAIVYGKKWLDIEVIMAPPVGFEPTTQRLTAACSATELQGNAQIGVKSIKRKFKYDKLKTHFF